MFILWIEFSHSFFAQAKTKGLGDVPQQAGASAT